MLILEVGAVIGVAVYKDDVEKGLKEGLTRSMQNYQGESAIDKEQTAIWDNMQERVSEFRIVLRYTIYELKYFFKTFPGQMLWNE